MLEKERFEQLKQQFINATEEHLAYIKNLSVEDVETDERRYELIKVYCSAMDSTMELAEFVTKKRHFKTVF